MSQPDSTKTAPEPEAGRAELRRAAFLTAARHVFLEYGDEAANMAEIVKRAGGSLSTLYAQFGGKKGLFEAMIDARVTDLTEQMHIELAAHAPLREGLKRIGEAFLFKQLEVEALDVFRLMVAQAKKFPELAESWGKRAPEAVRRALAEYLMDRAKAGEIKISNPDRVIYPPRPGRPAGCPTSPHLSCSRWCSRSWGRRGRSRPAASGRRTACSRGRRCGRPWRARSGWPWGPGRPRP